MEDNESDSSLITLIELSDNEDENEYVFQSDEEIPVAIEKNEVKLNSLKRAKRNWQKCMGCDERANLHRPTKRMRLHFCKSKKIYIQANDRICDFHLQDENWNEMHVTTASNFSGKILDEMIPFLLNSNLRELENHDKDVDIGITEVQFQQVLVELGFPQNPNKIEQKHIKSVRLYMERLRHGHTFKQMAHRHITNRRLISKRVKIGRNILLQRFVPSHIGYGNMSRETLLNHTTDLARMLYCNNDNSKCVCIWDGTYIHLQHGKLYTPAKNILGSKTSPFI